MTLTEGVWKAIFEGGSITLRDGEKLVVNCG
jgi:hypothetical protein